MRENREREARGQSTRRKIGIKLRVAKGVVALSNRDYEKAGREFGAVGEEGALEDWEGEVCPSTILLLWLCGDERR